MDYKVLESLNFEELYAPFLRAFSDYIIPMHLSQQDLRELLTRRGVNLRLSAGAFMGDRLVGFNLNGIDLHNKTLTAYDLATGVIPEHRHQGIARRLFDFSIPLVIAAGAHRYLLEVIQKNVSAIRTYRKIGFRVLRKLESFRGRVPIEKGSAQGIEFREIDPQWPLFESFWQWNPSWQNSIHSICRSEAPRMVIGGFDSKRLIAYGIVFPSNGDVPQFAVDRDYRKQSIGRALFMKLQELSEADLRVVNVDSSSRSTISFLETIGLTHFLTQHEMVLNFE